jgi:antitoxin PrlF
VPIATVSTKGQVTIPKEVRDQLRLTAGSRVSFVLGEKDSVTLKPVKSDIRLLKGMIKSPFKRPVTIKQMNDAIGRGYSSGLP